MQAYRDNNYGSQTSFPHDGGHQYAFPQDSSQGFRGVSSDSGQYRNVMSQSQTDLVGTAYRPQSWDSSRYGLNTYRDQRRQQTRRSKFVIIGGIVAILILVAIAVVVGIVVGRQNSHKKTADNNVIAGDPSVFDKDPNLHQSFYGLAYTPEGSQLPNCGNNLEDVIKDVQIMSQLTTRIRLYGADCNQSALVLEAIDRTKVNMTVWLGNYNIPNDNGAAYNRQRDVLKEALQSYGTDHLGGITVGNEFMLNYVTQLGSTDVNSPQANQGAQILISNIEDTESMLKGMSLSTIPPVGNADAGSFFNKQVLSSVNYGMANVHPWFANISASQSANWTTSFFQEQDQALADSLTNHPQMYIAETGWPTKSSDAGNENNGASDASPGNLQIFLDTFVCQANGAGIKYFFFEFKDEPWKDAQFGGVEGWWGLFTSNRTMKPLTIPNCQSP